MFNSEKRQTVFFGSSRFLRGLSSDRSEGEEVVLIPLAVADSLGNLDLVVEAFRPAGADVVPGMCDKTFIFIAIDNPNSPY